MEIHAASLVGNICLLARDDLAQHDHAITIHESYTGETLAILEGVCDERLLRLERALSHLVGLQGGRLFQLLAASFLAHLPDELGDTACGSAATHETDRRVARPLIGPLALHHF